MKNVLLLGDSIRIGYDKAVKASLEGKANVVFTADNNMFASHLLRFICGYKNDLLGDAKVDVIHWNAGLWDCLRLYGEEPHTPIDIYAYYIDRVSQRIKNCYPDAKVIFATSTAVISEKMSKDFKRYNEDIEAYNKVAIEVVTKYGFDVDDLYSVSKNLPEELHSDAVHYYTAGATEAFTKKVLSHICAALGIDVPEYVEVVHTDKPIGI